MKIFALAAAAAVAITGLAPVGIAAPVAAQQHERVVVRQRTVVHTERRNVRRPQVRQVCDWKWRNHHRVRVCHTVRSYR